MGPALPPRIADPPDGSDGSAGRTATTGSTPSVDDLPNPKEYKRRELRERALEMVLSGSGQVRKNGSTVVRIGTKKADFTRAERARSGLVRKSRRATVDQYVELARERTDRIFVVLTEFGDNRATDIDPDTPTRTPIRTPRARSRFDGPLHNQIPEPDRAVDNTTIWRPTTTPTTTGSCTSAAWSESLKTYYEKQSSGRYTVNGQVTDWVKVQYNEARYGRSNGFPCASNVCANTWSLVRDAIDEWVNQPEGRRAGPTHEIKAALSGYDSWDRYDFDGDGNFNEADGYVDHFQIVHAGGDQADGDPYQGEDAIWSHRWRAFQCTGQERRWPGQKSRRWHRDRLTTGLWVGRLHHPGGERRALGLRP